jgi:hypothetical protein
MEISEELLEAQGNPEKAWRSVVSRWEKRGALGIPGKEIN